MEELYSKTDKNYAQYTSDTDNFLSMLHENFDGEELQKILDNSTKLVEVMQQFINNTSIQIKNANDMITNQQLQNIERDLVTPALSMNQDILQVTKQFEDVILSPEYSEIFAQSYIEMQHILSTKKQLINTNKLDKKSMKYSSNQRPSFKLLL